MILFRDGAYIGELFNDKLIKIQKAINEYNYLQLKDFSDEEIRTISTIGLIEEIIINFEDPSFETSLGKMEEYNPFRFRAIDPQYIEVDSIDVLVKIPIIQGINITEYSANSHTFLTHADNTEMDIRHENNCSYLSFVMQFSLSRMNEMEQKQQAEHVNREYDDAIYCAKSRYNSINAEIRNFNEKLFLLTKKEMDTKIKKDSALDMFSKAIGVTVAPKNSAREKGEKILITPKKIVPNLPEKKTYEGYYIDNTNYHAILQTIREHLTATEILPKPIQKLSDEELIRDTILWALNANYIVATGETFRAAGKTDINVSFSDKSAFIAECKIWHGPNTFSEALEQVYGYATWRDCRIAVLIFNLKNQDFGKLLTTLETQITSNDNYISSSKKSANEWECKFKSKTDSAANITVNVFAADYCLRK